MFRSSVAGLLPALVIGALCSVANAGVLSGSLDLAPLVNNNIDLTTEGTEDWALWGTGSFPALGSLTPDVRKAGGGVISITELNGNAVNEFSQFSTLPSFSWSDGDSITSGTNVFGSLVSRGNGVGSGFGLTLPADTNTRTLKIYAQAFQGDARLTATLSDGSAPAYNSALVGDFIAATDSDEPGVYTLTYAADSANQSLDVSLQLVSDKNGSAPFESVGIRAASLAVDQMPPNSGGGGSDPGAVPEPASMLVWTMLLLTGVGYRRFRGNK